MAFERLPIDPHVDALIRLFAAAQSHIRGLLGEAFRSGALGTLRYRRQRLQMIRDALQQLDDRAIPQARDVVERSYEYGQGLAPSVEPVVSFGTGFHQEATGILADNLEASLRDSIQRVGRQAEDAFRREALRASAFSLLEGEPRKATIEMVRQLQDAGIKSFIDKAGRRWNLDTYAAVAIRTTTREAVSQGTANRMREIGYDLIQISHHEHKSDICDAYDGRTFSLSGDDPQFPQADMLPPYHPNCRHVAFPSPLNAQRNLERMALGAA